MYAGKQFEKEATSAGTGGQYYALIRRNIGRIRMLFSSEMDCFDDDPVRALDGMKRFVEPKAFHMSTYRNQRRSFNWFKAPSIWFQSFISGSDCIVLGSFGSEGELADVKEESAF